jgi:DNA-binding response OmpR family regulator
VLVVDDDRQITQLICAALSLGGYKLVCVESLAGAIYETGRGNCETVLLDLTLLDSTPADTLRAIPSLLEAGAGQVVVVSGCDVTESLRDYAIRAGAAEFLSKSDGEFFKKMIAAVVAYQKP